MTATPEQFHQVALYDGSSVGLLQLVETIAAMANTAGGSIEIGRISGDGTTLDPAALRKTLDRYVGPRVKGLQTLPQPDGGIVIHVHESESKPHVFTADGVLGDEESGRRCLFHKGQIWVRRGAANRPGGVDDLQQMVRHAAGEFLQRLSIGIRDPAFSLRLSDSEGIPVRLAEDEESVPVSPNLARLYPYTTKTLAGELGRPANWVAIAIKVLQLKESREHAYGVPSPSGRVIQWRYSERALAQLRGRVAVEPGWNPYHDR